MSIAFRRGDNWSTAVDFSVSLSNHTLSAWIESPITGEQLVAIAVTITDAALGQINLSLSQAATGSLEPGSYLWRLVWVGPGNVRRTALEGIAEVAR